MIQNERLIWLDIAKGIAILLMVFGHSTIPAAISDFIWAFHMPLFFIASGYTTNWDKHTLGYFATHKAKAILLPFLIYSLILLLLSHVSSEPVSLGNFLSYGWISWALWFVPVLYFATILTKLVYIFSNNYLRIIIVLIYLIIAWGLSYYKIQLAWSLSTVPIAAVFVVIGTELNKISFLQTTSPKFATIIVFLTFVVTALISHLWRLDLCFNKILPLAPLLIGAITGTIMTFAFSILVEKLLPHVSALLESIGRETFVIVAFSQIIIVLLNDHLTLNAIYKYTILFIVLAVIAYAKNIIKQTINNLKRVR